MDKRILEQVTLFKGIPIENLNNTIECLNGNEKHYCKNQIIIMESSEISSLGIILEGSVQIIRADIMGNRTIIASLKRGDIFGETFASAGVTSSPVSVLASEISHILWLSIEKIVTPCQRVCSFHSVLIMNLLKLLADKNLYLNNKLNILSKRSIRDKIMAYLTMHPRDKDSSTFHVPLNRNELADYLCIDRSALSRELSKLKKEGILDYHRNEFIIYRKEG